MTYTNTQGLVLRSVNYRDNDRILTLLTPQRGRVEAMARGCRKPNSPLMSASQLFTLGDYTLFKGKGHELLTNCEVKDSYYPLRSDYDKLTYASIILSSAELAAQPEEPQNYLMILLARTLSRLAYTTLDNQAVTAAYLLHFATLIGYKPRLLHCVLCNQSLENLHFAWLDPQAGGLVCENCCTTKLNARKLEPDAIQWLKSVLKHGIEKTRENPNTIPLVQLKLYVEGVLDHPLPKLPEYFKPL